MECQTHYFYSQHDYFDVVFRWLIIVCGHKGNLLIENYFRGYPLCFLSMCPDLIHFKLNAKVMIFILYKHQYLP